MKQTPQQKAKTKLKTYYRFKECDFYELDEVIYLNCQDNVGIIVRDIWEDLELTRKENIEL